MTQRVDLATVMDRLAIDGVVTAYAAAVDNGDWTGFRDLFVPDGRADYTGADGIEGTAAEVGDWLAGTLGLFGLRQHLIVNRQVRIQDLGGYPGDRAEMRADCLSFLRRESGQDVTCGSRFTFGLQRGDSVWQLRTVIVQEKWRSTNRFPSAG